MKRLKIEKINEDASIQCSSVFSKILCEKVDVKITTPLIVNVKSISDLIEARNRGVGVYVPINGDISGACVFLFSDDSATSLCDKVLNKTKRTISELSSYDKEVLKELGNILLGCYLAVFSNISELEIIGGMPKISCDMFGAILEEITSNIAINAQQALVFKIEFTTERLRKEWIMILIVESKEVNKIFGSIK